MGMLTASGLCKVTSSVVEDNATHRTFDKRSSDDAAKPVYQRAAAKLQYVANDRLDALRCFGTLWWFVFTCAPSSRLAGCYTRWAVTETSSGRTACWNAGQVRMRRRGVEPTLGAVDQWCIRYCQWKSPQLLGEEATECCALEDRHAVSGLQSEFAVECSGP